MQVGRLLCGSYAMNCFPLRAHLIGEKEKIGEKNMLGWEEKRGGGGRGEGVKWQGSVFFSSTPPFR